MISRIRHPNPNEVATQLVACLSGDSMSTMTVKEIIDLIKGRLEVNLETIEVLKRNTAISQRNKIIAQLQNIVQEEKDLLELIESHAQPAEES